MRLFLVMVMISGTRRRSSSRKSRKKRTKRKGGRTGRGEVVVEVRGEREAYALLVR